MIIKIFSPEEAKLIVKELLLQMETPYNTAYERRYLPMLNEGSLKEVFIIYIGEKAIGVLILKEVPGEEYFSLESKVLRFTMFRILPDERGKGYGKTTWEEVTKYVFKKYNIDKLFSESREFGALKLYSRIEGVKFFDNQFVKGIRNEIFEKEVLFNIDFLKNEYKNHDILVDNIKFYMERKYFV